MQIFPIVDHIIEIIKFVNCAVTLTVHYNQWSETTDSGALSVDSAPLSVVSALVNLSRSRSTVARTSDLLTAQR